MGFTSDMLKSMSTPLYGLAGESIHVVGSVELCLTESSHHSQATIMVNFLTIDYPFVYNMIIGKLALNALRAAISMYHLAKGSLSQLKLRWFKVNNMKYIGNML